MAFPTNTTIIDNFNRGNANTLGASWTAAGIGNQTLFVLNNTAGTDGSHSATYSEYYSASTYGPDVEAFATIPTLTGDASGSWGVMARVTSGGNGYYVEYTEDHNITVYKMTGWSVSAIGAAIARTLSNGHKLGISITGSSTTTIEVFTDEGAGWVSRGTRTDSSSPYTAAGYRGLLLYIAGGANFAAAWDDFGGGTVVAAASNYSVSVSESATVGESVTVSIEGTAGATLSINISPTTARTQGVRVY